jgi:hypothetical protein
LAAVSVISRLDHLDKYGLFTTSVDLVTALHIATLGDMENDYK